MEAFTAMCGSCILHKMAGFDFIATVCWGRCYSMESVMDDGTGERGTD